MSPFRLLLAASFAVVAILTTVPALAQSERGTRLTYGITGENRQSGRRDPGHLLGQAAVQALVIEASQAPLAPDRAARLLTGADASVEDLIATGILRRREDGSYALALNYLSIADQQAIRAIAEQASHSLAAAFLRSHSRFDALLARYPVPGIGRPALAMSLIGAVVLDWDGLGLTATEGYRLPMVRQGTGDQYVPWARERGPAVTVRGLYWGSHNSAAGPVTLTTFGDHHALPRMALPDLFWSIGPDQLAPHVPAPVRQALVWPARSRWNEMQADAALLMLRLREGPADSAGLAQAIGRQPADLRRTLELLESLHYVSRDGDRYMISVPVFTARDRAMIEEVRAEGRRIMSNWLRQNYPSIRARLANLSAVRAGVRFEQLFTEIWHDLFGWTNYRLAAAGLLIDPHGPDSRFQGFQPFVWETALDLQAGTRAGG